MADPRRKHSCPANIFSQFESGLNTYVTPDEEGKHFLYEMLSYAEETAVVKIAMNELKDTHLDDWGCLEDWCDEIYPGFLWELISESENEILKEQSPKNHFESKVSLQEKVIEKLSTVDEQAPIGGDRIPMYVEIECSDKQLFLIYEGSDGWSLGHHDCVFVVASLEELTPEKGFHPILPQS